MTVAHPGGLSTTPRPPGEGGLWSAFATAREPRAFATAWLALLLAQVPAAEEGVVLAAEGGTFVPVAIAPDPRRPPDHLRPAAEKALTRGRGVIEPAAEGARTAVAYPVTGGGRIEAVVVLGLRPAPDPEVQEALRALHWAAGWLSARAWEREAGEAAARLARAGTALDALAVTEEHPQPRPAAMAVAGELSAALGCDRVSLGLVARRRSSPRVRLLAMSHSAWFRRRSSLAQGLEAAMDEAFDQNAPVAWPALPDTSRAIDVAHADHARAAKVAHVLTVPLADATGPIGALTLERREGPPFDVETLHAAEAVAALIGPVLELKRRNRRWLAGRLVDGTTDVLGVLLGPRRLSWKLLALGLAALAVAAATVTGPFRVTAPAVLRGLEQRAAVAPFQGYIDRAPVRAGDVVAEGDLLAALDDDDLRLEELRWSSEIDRLAAQQREALARYDRPQVALLDAQIRQARAQLDLARIKVARTEIRAPIAGLIVAGDLSQRLGSPVQPGEVLFEIAPQDAFRIDLYVDERDLRHVAEGATGRLALTGLPSEGLDLTILRITPVAEAREGANTFRVEAALGPSPFPLRPGMEGVAKVEAGEARLVWIWTRRLVDWLRETAWTWRP